MNRHLALLCLALLGAGCAALDSGAVRDLSRSEQQAFDALDRRLDANRPLLADATATLGELGAEWTEQAFELERALARAKRLETMRAPWAAVRDEFSETQRSVVLYHLFELDMAEQRLLEARMAERRAAARELLAAYDRHADILADATDNLALVMQYLDQPNSARIAEFTAAFLGEVSAFRSQLQQSDNPRLQALAEDVARHEGAVLGIRQQADEALQAFLRLKELGD